jgi:Dockerin type I domain
MLRTARKLIVAHVYMAAAICGLGFPANFSLAVVIDDFQVGAITVVGPSVQTQGGLDSAHVLGGSRLMNVGQHGNGSVLEIDPGSGLNFQSSGWGYFTLKYDFTADGAGTDLTAGSQDRIRVRFGDVQTSYTLFGLYLTLPPNSSNNGVSISFQNWDGLILEVPFSAFPSSPTAAQNLTLDISRNPAGSSFVIESITTAGSPTPGDYNRDGVVDVADYHVWKRFAGISTRNGVKWPIASADGNADGVVDAADYITWRKAAGSTSGGGASSSIPEPTTLIPVAIALVIGYLNERQSRRRD